MYWIHNKLGSEIHVRESLELFGKDYLVCVSFQCCSATRHESFHFLDAISTKESTMYNTVSK